MASINKRGNEYYCKVSYKDDYGRYKTVEIPLDTGRRSKAETRQNEVEKYTTKIQEDRAYKEIGFSWLNGGGKTVILKRSLQDTFDEYISVRRIEGVRQKTVDLYELAFSSLMGVIGSQVYLEQISDSDICDWKKWSSRHHSPNTTNIYLAKMKAFFKYCYKKRYIKYELDIEKVTADVKPPMYLSDSKLGALLTAERVNTRYRKAFMFYVLTGCRKNEPFEGTVTADGMWLIVTPDVSKTHIQREVELTPKTASILYEMRKYHSDNVGTKGHGSKSKSSQGIIDSYSKAFKTSVTKLGFGEHKMHNLRDTYATRRWAETGDIHLVSKEIGHTSVTMTQKYANFKLGRLAGDFQSLKEVIEKRLSKTISNDSLIGLGGNLLSGVISVGDWRG